MRLNIGFLGTRGIANDLAAAVHRARNARLYAVAARTVERTGALEPRLVYRDYADLLADPSVDLVYVAPDNPAHLEWVERALRHSKHVLCEKPLGRTVTEAARIFPLANTKGLLLTEARENRWHPRTREFEDFVAAGGIGRVREVTARFHVGAPKAGEPRYAFGSGGSTLLDVGCRALAGALSCFDWAVPEVVEVSTRGWSTGAADSTVSVRLGYPDGARMTVSASVAGDVGQELDVLGSAGKARMTPPVFTAGGTECALETWNGKERSVRHYSRVNAAQIMIESVVDRVLGADTFTVAPRESLAVATVVDAVLQHAGGPRCRAGLPEESAHAGFRRVPGDGGPSGRGSPG